MSRFQPKINETQKIKITKAFEFMDFFGKDCYSEEKNNLAKEWLKKKRGVLGCFIDGQNRKGDGAEAEIIDRQQIELCDIVLSSKDQFDVAARSSCDAFSAWYKFDKLERVKILIRIADKIKENQNLFLQLQNSFSGKPTQDVQYLIESFEHCSRWLLSSKSCPKYKADVRYFMNFCSYRSLVFLAWHVSAAIAGGNTFVVISSQELCLPALLLAEICYAAGLPSGVFNVITTDETAAQQLVMGESKLPLYLFYINGQHIEFEKTQHSLFGQRVKYFPSSFVVFKEADIDSACVTIAENLTCNISQFSSCKNCISMSEVLVQDSVKDELVKKLEKHLSSLTKSLDSTWMTFKLKHITDVKTVGGILETGVKKCPQNTKLKEGILTYCKCFFNSGGTVSSAEEDHAAILQVVPFRTTKEAISIFNHKRKDGTVSVWCERINTSFEIVHALNASTVCLNCHNEIDAEVPYDGIYSVNGLKAGGRNSYFEMFEYILINDESSGDSANVNAVSELEGRNSSSSVKEQEFKFEPVYHHFYGGINRVPDNNQYISSCEAARNILVANGSKKDVYNAIDSALAVKSKWMKLSQLKRSQVLINIAKNLETHQEKFVSLLQKQNPDIKSCQDEVALSIKVLYHWASSEILGTRAQKQGNVLEICTPLGLIGIFCLECYSLLAFVCLVAEAISAGNVVVVVLSHFFPFPPLLLSELFKSADVPAGVINMIVNSKSDLSLNLANHPEVDSFWLMKNNEYCDWHLINQEVDVSLKRLRCCPNSMFRNPLKLEPSLRSVFHKTVWMPVGNIYP